MVRTPNKPQTHLHVNHKKTPIKMTLKGVFFALKFVIYNDSSIRLINFKLYTI